MVSDRGDLVLAVDVGGTRIKGEIVEIVPADPGTPSGRLGATIAADSASTPQGQEALDTIVAVGRRLLGQLSGSDRSRVAGAGVAVPGLLDLESGVALNTVNLSWRDTPVVKPVSAALGLPVTLSHDVQAAGTAEWRAGAGRGVDDLLVVIVGTGVAAVLIVGGRLVTGGLSQPGELGHIVVRPDGALCACGQHGCVETLASAAAIARRYETVSGRQVAGAADVRGRLGADPAADAVWSDAIGALSDGLMAACALFSPTRVVIGGGLAEAGDELLGPLHDRMIRTWRVAAVPDVVPADLGSRAGVVGAALGVWK